VERYLNSIMITLLLHSTSPIDHPIPDRNGRWWHMGGVIRERAEQTLRGRCGPFKDGPANFFQFCTRRRCLPLVCFSICLVVSFSAGFQGRRTISLATTFDVLIAICVCLHLSDAGILRKVCRHQFKLKLLKSVKYCKALQSSTRQRVVEYALPVTTPFSFHYST
jgi:hypothetical protein